MTSIQPNIGILNFKKQVHNSKPLFILFVGVAAFIYLLVFFIRRNSTKNIFSFPPFMNTSKLFESTNSSSVDEFIYNIHENTNFLEQSKYYSLQNTRVNPDNYEFLVKPRYVCDLKPYLMILVPSVHTHKIIRNTIRRTWGSVEWPQVNLKQKVKLVFLFGMHQHPEMEFIIHQEAEIFNDIVQAKYIDSYFNLTLKILNGLRWVSEYCQGVKYVLKADEDTFTNIPLLLDFLEKKGIPRVVIGHLHEHSTVKRVGKWGVSKSLFPLQTYPDYMAGNTYLLSGDIILKLVNTAQYVSYLNIEDVFITGVLVRILQLRQMDVLGFTQWASQKPDMCSILQNKIITGNGMKIEYTETIWKALHQNISQNC